MKSLLAAALALASLTLALGLAGRTPAASPTADPETLCLAVWQPPATLDLAGDWLLSLPAGFSREVTLTPLGGGRFRLQPGNLNCAGAYVLRDGVFLLEEAFDRRDEGYRWQFLNANVLVLTAEPGNRGARYVGATLSRKTANPETTIVATDE